MPHLDCVPVPTPAVHPATGPDGFEFEKHHQQQQSQQQKAYQQAKADDQQHHQNHQNQKPNNREQQQKRKIPSKGMCQTVTEESLSQFQLDKLAELRAKLGDQLLAETPLFNDNFSLLRWLYGWNYRIEEILPRFKKASSVFRCMRINDLLHMDDVDAINEFSRTLTSAADYFPGGIMGYDREGNVVALQAMGQSHPKQLSKCGRVSDVYRLCVVETALIYQLIRLQEAKQRRKLGLRVIIDLDGFNSDHLTTMGLKVYSALLKSMQDIFPDLLRQVYVINAHYLVKTAYAIVKTVLSEQSREKVIFLDTSFHEHLARDIGPENLFPRWGGTKDTSRGHPDWGTLRIGGIPPQSLRYCPATHPAHMPDEQLKKVSVPARQRREIEIAIPPAAGIGQQMLLNWFWTSSSDVDFGVFTMEEEQEVWPMFRLLTDFVPEYGAVRVECGRNYKFVIDNSFSVFTKKEVKFGYKLNPVEQQEEAEEVRMPLDAKVNGQEEKVPDDEKENEERMNNGRMNGNAVGKMGML